MTDAMRFDLLIPSHCGSTGEQVRSDCVVIPAGVTHKTLLKPFYPLIVHSKSCMDMRSNRFFGCLGIVFNKHQRHYLAVFMNVSSIVGATLGTHLMDEQGIQTINESCTSILVPPSDMVSDIGFFGVETQGIKPMGFSS